MKNKLLQSQIACPLSQYLCHIIKNSRGLMDKASSLESKIRNYHDKMFAQRGARTHDPEIKSLMLYRLS